MSGPISDWLLGDLDMKSTDVRNWAESVRYDIDHGSYGDAADLAEKLAAAAEDLSRAAREIAQKCRALPPKRCEACGNGYEPRADRPVWQADDLCPACEALSPAEVAALYRERPRS